MRAAHFVGASPSSPCCWTPQPAGVSSGSIRAYLGEKRLRSSGLSEQGQFLVIPIPEIAGDLTLLIRPLDPPSGPSRDERSLGLPIFSLDLQTPASPVSVGETRERAPVT